MEVMKNGVNLPQYPRKSLAIFVLFSTNSKFDLKLKVRVCRSKFV